jgi:hypothetical protein
MSKLCLCGCGEKAKPGNRFILYHHRRGTHQSEEFKINVSLKHKNKILSDETKRLISEAQIGEKNHNYNKTMPDEQKKKISKAMMGKTHGFQKGCTPSIKSSGGIQSVCKKGHNVRSSWERRFVDLLFDENIPYFYEPERFNLRGISYLPDIYIPHLDLWIEIKGYMTVRSKIQHELFRRAGHKLLVLDDPKVFKTILREIFLPSV